MKVLFFIDRLRLGGIQVLVRDILQHTVGTDVSIDVLTMDDGIVYPLEQELKNLGVCVFKLNGIWLRRPWDYLRYRKAVDQFFSEHHDYDVVHMHSSSKNYYILERARKAGIPVRVAHAHNTGFQTHNPLSILLGNWMKPKLVASATVLLGCSELACQWLFGSSKKKPIVLFNGIEPMHFAFNTDIRTEVRRELNIEDKFVIGHVGRFEKQKNHTYLIDSFAEVHKQMPEAVLVLVGIGSLEDEMKARVASLGLQDDVRFLGFRDDRERVMQAMDCFVMPSLYEGFSVVLIEAQAAGLPVLVSDSTTKETKCTENITFLSLTDGPKAWAKEIIKIKNNSAKFDRSTTAQQLVGTKFDIERMIKELTIIWKGNGEDTARS